MSLDPERLRAWVYDALIRPTREVGANSGGLQLGDISRWVKQKAQQAGSVPQDSHFASSNLDKRDEDAIRECIWGLIIQGIVVPGIKRCLQYKSTVGASDPMGRDLPKDWRVRAVRHRPLPGPT